MTPRNPVESKDQIGMIRENLRASDVSAFYVLFFMRRGAGNADKESRARSESDSPAFRKSFRQRPQGVFYH